MSDLLVSDSHFGILALGLWRFSVVKKDNLKKEKQLTGGFFGVVVLVQAAKFACLPWPASNAESPMLLADLQPSVVGVGTTVLRSSNPMAFEEKISKLP